MKNVARPMLKTAKEADLTLFYSRIEHFFKLTANFKINQKNFKIHQKDFNKISLTHQQCKQLQNNHRGCLSD